MITTTSRPTALLCALLLTAVAACSKAPPTEKPAAGDDPGAKATPDKATTGDKEGDKAEDKAVGEESATDEAAGDKAGVDPGASAAVQLDKPGEDADFTRIEAETDKYRERVVRCKVLLSPLPMEVRPFGDSGPATLLPAKIDDRWTTVFCRTHKEGMDALPVQLYFAEGQKGHLLHIDRETLINVEIRGRFANQLVGLFRGVAEEATEKAFHNDDAPDLVSALLWPERFVDKKLRCINKLAVSPQDVAQHDQKAADMVRDHVAPKKATLHCEDRRGVSVSVALFFPVDKVSELLKIGASTEVSFSARGFYNNQLVGMFEGISAGALASGGEGGARRILLDPKPWIGKTVECETLTAPQPGPIRQIDEGEMGLLKAKLDPVKTALMCAEKSGGSVGASVYFPAGKMDELLKIGSRTRVKLQIWGVRSNRLVALFAGVVSGGVETKDPKDMRAVALRPDKFAGQKLGCKVVLKPYVAEVAFLGSDKEAMLKGVKLARRNAVLTCQDATSELDGTRIELYFEEKHGAAVDGLKKGEEAPFKLLGAAYGTLVGLYAGK